MKTRTKIKITESQFERLKPRLTEVGNDNAYRMTAKVSFVKNGEILPGKEISNIVSEPITISYFIDLDYKSWGIRGANIYGFKGPSQINVNVEYFDGDNDSSIELPLVLNWDNVKENIEKGAGVIGLGQEIEIYIFMDPSGKLQSRAIKIDVNTI